MWYVIQVQTGREHGVAELCRKQVAWKEEAVFVPLCKRKKKIKGQRVTVTSTLFPGYLFFETKEPEQLFFRLKKIRQLTKLLATGENFTPLSESEEHLLTGLGGKDHVIEVSTGIIEGSDVIITEGPLCEFTGRIKKIDRHKCVAIIEIEMMGEVREVTLGLEIIEKRPEEVKTC